MANPLIAQGTLNRLRASVNVPLYPQLNVTASFLGKSGITLLPEGDTTTFLPQMTGVVTSSEPYQAVTVGIELLKTQFLSDLYKQQQELDARIGDIIVRPDTRTLSRWYLYNCAIQNVGQLSFAGDSAAYGITLKGFWVINQNLWVEA